MGCASSLRRNSNVGDDYYDGENRRFSILRRKSSRGKQLTGPLHLPTTKVTFTRDQLACLNHYFNEQLDNRDNDVDISRDSSDELHSLVERLIQRLICTVGTLDPRFASMLLINANPLSHYSKQQRSSTSNLRLSYLVRLDQLSFPPTFEEEEGEEDECNAEMEGRGYDQEAEEQGAEGRPVCVVCEGGIGEGSNGPQGFAKIRLQGDGCHRWAEFVNNSGYLRRDKIQERFVELLAQAVAKGTHKLCSAPCDVDETLVPGAPGKVMPHALAAQQVLATPASQRCYYGPASNHRNHFPDPRDFRIAIVDGGGGAAVRMRVALLGHNQLFNSCSNSTGDRHVSVTLTLGVEAQGWPRSADFPLPRTSITHCDALLYQRAATTGFYLVPCAPHPSTPCDDRSATWQMRFPAAQQLLLSTHPKTQSTGAHTLATLSAIVGEMHRSTVGGCRTASQHLLATLVWFALEQEATTPLQAMRIWHRSQLSRHVLKCLDQLIGALQTQRQRCYFFPWLNVVLNPAAFDASATVQHFTEEDFIHDAQLLHTYVTRLHSVSQSPAAVLRCGDGEEGEGEGENQVTSELRRRWTRLLADMTPAATASERAYSPRQLAYVGQLIRGMLRVKTLTLMQTQHMPSWQADHPLQQSGSEDIVYLLAAILEQASATNPNTSKRRKVSTSCTNRSRNRADTSAANYQSTVHQLLQQVRDDRCQPYNDDGLLVREVLRWLYLAVAFDPKHIGVVLRPFLSDLFTVSLENCWQQSTSCDLWQQNTDQAQESHALGRFCALVNNAGLKPRDGIVDALGKGWNWAAALVETASRVDGVELIFTPRERSTVRHRVTVLNYSKAGFTHSLGRGGNCRGASLLSTVTLPRRTVNRQEEVSVYESLAAHFTHVEGEEGEGGGGVGEVEERCQHLYLCATSPMTQVAMATANQRLSYATTIVHALITLNKFTVLQEIASLLPEDRRARTLDDIRRIWRQRRRNRAATVTAHAQTNSSSNSFSSQHSGRTNSTDRSLVRIDNVRINNNSNLTQQQQQRTRSCLNMTTMLDDNIYATYRSLDELAIAKTTDQSTHNLNQLVDNSSGDPHNNQLIGKSLSNNQLFGNFSSAHGDNTLLGTCRLARSRQSGSSTVCDTSFFDAPLYFADSATAKQFNPCAQPLLALTADNRLTLLRKSQQCRDKFDEKPLPADRRTKKEMVTKL